MFTPRLSALVCIFLRRATRARLCMSRPRGRPHSPTRSGYVARLYIHAHPKTLATQEPCITFRIRNGEEGGPFFYLLQVFPEMELFECPSKVVSGLPRLALARCGTRPRRIDAPVEQVTASPPTGRLLLPARQRSPESDARRSPQAVLSW